MKSTIKITSIKDVIAAMFFTCTLILVSLSTRASPIDGGTNAKITHQVNEATSVSPVTSIVSLNTSSLEKLLTLKGVGQVKAQAIIAYREQIGGFNAIEELTQVKGIGEKVLDDNMGRLQL